MRKLESVYIKMPGTFVALTRQRLVCLWIQHRQVYLYRNAIKHFHLHNMVQYCISVKDKDRDISKQIWTIHTKSESRTIIEESTNKLQEKKSKLMSSERINKDTLIYKKWERLYSNPKNSLHSIYMIVNKELNDSKTITSSFKQISTSNLWECTYNVKWPETLSFKGVGKNKTKASTLAALKCLKWLQKTGKLHNGKPVIYNKQQIKDIQSKPIELSVAPQFLNKIKNLIETYETNIRNIEKQDVSSDVSYNTLNQDNIVHSVIGETIMKNLYTRNKKLMNRLYERSVQISNLPIFKFRNEILSKLRDNQVLLIEGDTGCGKTTQVPQFIMDSFAQDANATNCNILVSQPRRISAISLADRIAYERGEIIGDVVGYHVRLEKIIPQELGVILFCTTGILLKKLQQDPSLRGCSHVILDEAHERSIDTDMLMILLKRSLKQNPNLKVLIMSATINTHLFQQYFNCPAVKVPGKIYPVEMNFLEDIERLPNFQKYSSSEYNFRNKHTSELLLVDCRKMVQIIKWISYNKPPGAILCFLPGWNEIMNVQTMLENAPLESEQQLILSMHSKISHEVQRKVFEQTPVSTRKIILATNIAETGITVSDVCYVVDSAIRKEIRWDYEKDTARISNHWISQANINQRKGRAGRVKPGESYHLITKTEYEKLQPYPVAQVLCNSLEKVVLDSKTYSEEKAENFLANLLEPPSPIAICKAVNYLIDLGVIDNEENLTALGRRIALFPTHPKFSKTLVYSTIFNCIHPILTIISAFSNDENIFDNILDDKHEIRKSKRLYHPSSDHIALAWIYKQWFINNLENPHLLPKFCKQMNLRQDRMNVLTQVRDKFIQQLIACRLLAKDIYDYRYPEIPENKYEKNEELIRALLFSATQQLIVHKDAGLKNGILRTGINKLRVQGKAKTMISGESVNNKRKVWPSPYLTYFYSAHCNARHSMVIRETSMISPLTVLLFSQRQIECCEQEDKVEIKIYLNNQHTLIFSCNKETSKILLKFKDIIWSMVQYSLEKQGINDRVNDVTRVLHYKDELLETLAETLRASSECIENADIDKSNTQRILS